MISVDFESRTRDFRRNYASEDAGTFRYKDFLRANHMHSTSRNEVIDIRVTLLPIPLLPVSALPD